MNTENNIAIVCITDNGKNLAVKIQKKLKEGKIYLRFSFDVSTEKNDIHILIEALKDIHRNYVPE